MDTDSETPYLAKLAEVFRREGDMATADALVRQQRSTASRTLGDHDVSRVRQLRREGVHLNNKGDHDRAEPLLVEALQIVEAALGPEHVDIGMHLDTLATCRFNNGDFETALADYSRLLRIIERDCEPGDALIGSVRHSVERSRKGLRDAIGVARLQAQMNSMLCQAQGARSTDAFSGWERTRKLAHRLMARGRFAGATRLFERWIEWRLQDVHPDEDLVLDDIRHCATALRAAGQHAKAASVLRGLVASRNRRTASGDDTTGLQQALADWQACLADMGERRSATEAAALVDSIANRPRQGERPDEAWRG